MFLCLSFTLFIFVVNLIGTNYQMEWIKNKVTALNDFVDNVHISLNGDVNENENSKVSLYLLDEGDIQTCNMYVIVFDKKKTEKDKVSLFMCDDTSKTKDTVYVTKDVRRHCELIAPNEVPSSSSHSPDIVSEVSLHYTPLLN